MEEIFAWFVLMLVGLVFVVWLLFQMWRHDCPTEYKEYKYKQYRRQHSVYYWYDGM